MIDWWGPVLVEYYAATEAGMVTPIDSAEWLAGRAASGRAVPPAEVLIVDGDGAECRPAPPAGSTFGAGRETVSVPQRPG